MTKNTKRVTSKSRPSVHLGQWFLVFTVAWTVVVGISLVLNRWLQVRTTVDLAQTMAEAGLERDLLYRQWNSMHGGVYVPVTEETKPNAHLTVPERDIQTPTGRKLTLVNPAYMTRQVHEQAARSNGVQGHITSLRPIRPENAADPWETTALEAFELGETMRSSVEDFCGEPHLRLMRPLVTEKACLKCHASQGYREGDIRGGISVSVPMSTLQDVESARTLGLVRWHGTFLLLGLCGIGAAYRRMKYEHSESAQRSQDLAIAHERLEDKNRELEETLEKLSKLTHAMNNCPVAVVITDAEGIVEYVNPHFTLMTGYTAEEAVGKSPRILNSEQTPNCALEEMWATLRAGKTWSGDLRTRTKSGKLIWERAILGPLQNADGEITHYVGVTEDISHRKVVEAESARYREQQEIVNSVLTLGLKTAPLDLILEQVLNEILSVSWLSKSPKGGMFLTSEDKQYLELKAHRNLEDQICQSCTRVPMGHCLCGRAALTEKVVFASCLDDRHDVRYEGMSPHGHYCVPIPGKDDPLGVLMVYLEHGHLRSESELSFLTSIAHSLASVIQRKKAESDRIRLLEETQQQKRLIQAVIESLDEGIVAADETGDFILANRRAEELCDVQLVGHADSSAARSAKYRMYELDGKTLVAEEDAPLNRAILGECTKNREVLMRREEGEAVLSINGAPLNFGGFVGGVVSFRDVTEQKTIERQLSQAQKLEAVGQLAAGVAHEINTPMQYLGDNLEFLQNKMTRLNPLLQAVTEFVAAEDACEKDALADDMRSALQSMKAHSYLPQLSEAITDSLDGVQHVSRIVRAMKEFAHPGQEATTPVDINRALESTIVVSTNEWKYVADVKTNLDGSVPLVPALAGELNQVFLNIIVNAAHAVGETNDGGAAGKGTITVSTRSSDGYVEVSIADTGTGIPDDVKKRIFDPFFTTKRIGKGTGQGLAIAHSVVVQKHGGKLWCDSIPGKGTTFFIQLPVEPLQKQRHDTLEPAMACEQIADANA